MHDVIIIGAGPAGLAAGLYCGRFRLNTLIVEKMVVGGQILMSATIENYPGVPGPINTQKLVEKMKQQVEEVDVPFATQEVSGICVETDRGLPAFTLTAGEEKLQARTVIVASGARYKQLGVQGETRLGGRGVSYCGTCDGPLFKNKEITLVGGGDRAIEEAIYLSSYASKVTVIHRRQDLRASRILQEQARRNPRIGFIFDAVVEEITGENKVEAVKVKNVKTGSTDSVACQGIFIFVGILPDTGFVKNLLKTDDSGFIITDQEMRTSQAGVFACGDCRAKSLYQVVTACAEGAVAADSTHKYLLNQGVL